MTDLTETLSTAERETSTALESQLEVPSGIALDVFNLTGCLIELVRAANPEFRSKPLRVCAQLLLRMSNDLRCASLLAHGGYPVQAVALTASLLETCLQLVYIGDDESRASDWLRHSDPKRTPFPNMEELCKEFAQRSGASDVKDVAERTYEVFSQLCMAKHSNPALLQMIGVQQSEDSVVYKNGPDDSEPSVRAAWYALYIGAKFMLNAQTEVLQLYVPSDKQVDIRAAISALYERCANLSREAKDRGWAKDPFPGKWKVFR